MFDNQTINQGETLRSDIVDMEGYSKVTVFLSSSNNGLVGAQTYPSIDGIEEYGNAAPGCSLGFGEHTCYCTGDIISPKIRLHLTKDTNPSIPSSSIVTVSLYLIP